jgi:Uma2 family endonuclease
VLSPNDRRSDVTKKIEEYFSIGVLSVWIADPERQEVFVYRALTELQRFSTDDTLRDEAVLPGFEVDVSELFGAGFE